MNKTQAKKLNKLIKLHVDAQISVSWSGSKKRGEAAVIRANAGLIERDLRDFIKTLIDQNPNT